MNILKYLSYVFPITRKITSQHSGTLELTLIDGKLVLDTKSTNYSYGSLQRILKFSLEQVHLTDIHKILLLGLGGGSVIETLRNDFNYTEMIYAVDIDETIIKIAEKEFKIAPDTNTKIFCMDAEDFISQTSDKFDLIIVDLFIDSTIPSKFLVDRFWNILISKANSKGAVIFNTLCKPPTDTAQIERMFSDNNFIVKIFPKVEGTNKILIATCID